MSAPKSLFALTGGSILAQDEAEAIAKKAMSYATGSNTVIYVTTSNERNTNFAKSQIVAARDAMDGRVVVTSTIGTRAAEVWTQRFDDDGLRKAVNEAESAAKQGPENRERSRPVPPYKTSLPRGLWYDATEATDLLRRAQGTTAALDRAKGYITAGSLDVDTQSDFVLNSAGLSVFSREAHVELTMTVRSPDNTGSGWAGQKGYDISKLNPEEVAATALDKCQRSRNPSAVEPGRWTTILEPAAYAGMMHFMMHNEMPLKYADLGYTVWANPKGGNKIGLKVMSERLSMVSDPTDPDGPFRPFSDTGVPFEKTYWIKDGILKDLPDDDEHAQKVGRSHPLGNPESIRLVPGESEKLVTLQEMISTCERGIYVTRLSGPPADFRYMTFSGVTRDGTWLIEKGKITRPIKNLRYLESPLFFLNNLEMVGKPELAPMGGAPAHVQLVLPPVRVRDFNFVSLADAV